MNALRFFLICWLFLLMVPSLQAQVTAGGKKEAVLDPFIFDRDRALSARAGHDFLAAKEIYVNMLTRYPQDERCGDIHKELWNLNVAIVSSAVITHQSELYTIEPGDTLGKIAKKFGTTIELIKKRNHLENNKIIAGHKLSVWLGAFTIAIDKSDNTLTLKSADETIKVYPVSTGKDNSSPTGEFTIKDRFTDPVWFHKGDVVPANDPKNYLGTRWLGFDLPKYGIHGTIEPEFIGQQVSSGCIRMRNEDVQELYDLVPMGTHVTIAD